MKKYKENLEKTYFFFSFWNINCAYFTNQEALKNIRCKKNQYDRFHFIPSGDRNLIKSRVAWIKFLDILLLHIFKPLNIRSSDNFSISKLWLTVRQSWDVVRETFRRSAILRRS